VPVADDQVRRTPQRGRPCAEELGELLVAPHPGPLADRPYAPSMHRPGTQVRTDDQVLARNPAPIACAA
jgi:hypothetical protein